MEWLRWESVYNATHNRPYFYTLVSYSKFDGMDTGSSWRSQYTVLSMGFGKDFSCNMVRNRRIFSMLGRLVFGDKRGFLQRCRLLLMVDEVDDHWLRVS